MIYLKYLKSSGIGVIVDIVSEQDCYDSISEVICRVRQLIDFASKLTTKNYPVSDVHWVRIDKSFQNAMIEIFLTSTRMIQTTTELGACRHSN